MNAWNFFFAMVFLPQARSSTIEERGPSRGLSGCGTGRAESNGPSPKPSSFVFAVSFSPTHLTGAGWQVRPQPSLRAQKGSRQSAPEGFGTEAPLSRTQTVGARPDSPCVRFARHRLLPAPSKSSLCPGIRRRSPPSHRSKCICFLGHFETPAKSPQPAPSSQRSHTHARDRLVPLHLQVTTTRPSGTGRSPPHIAFSLRRPGQDSCERL